LPAGDALAAVGQNLRAATQDVLGNPEQIGGDDGGSADCADENGRDRGVLVERWFGTEKDVAMRMTARVLGGVFAALMMASGARAQDFGPACALMSQATAAEINGAPVSAGQEQDDLGAGNMCVFNGNGNDGRVSVSEAAPSMMGLTTAQMFKRREMVGPTVAVLSGLGDGAYITHSGPDYDLWVLVKQVELDISVVHPQGPASGLQAAMTAAAKIALPKM
jgi:hypothetical protein